MHWITATFEHYLETWGYWAVLLALLGENAGIPLPGETILLLASVLAFRSGRLHLEWIIVVGIAAATLGDNLGYFIGRHGGRPLLRRWKHIFRIRDEHVRAGEAFIRRRGMLAIFVARFIAGMRILAGPLAGVLDMDWRKFFLANAAGAAVWVTTISLAGYLFGSRLPALEGFFSKTEFFLLALVLAGFAWYFWRRRRTGRDHP
jgi:membrane protein DedA with SNARE-associated domain